eukprot:8023056-Pyramimonas_sp.AAC.1
MRSADQVCVVEAPNPPPPQHQGACQGQQRTSGHRRWRMPSQMSARNIAPERSLTSVFDMLRGRVQDGRRVAWPAWSRESEAGKSYDRAPSQSEARRYHL